MPVYKYRSTVTANWDRLAHLVGRITGRETIEVEGKPRESLLVDAGRAIYRVFESAALEDVFKDAVPGDCVDIAPLPKISLKGGRTFRPFKAALFTLSEGESFSPTAVDAASTSVPPTTSPTQPQATGQGEFHATDEDVPF